MSDWILLANRRPDENQPAQVVLGNGCIVACMVRSGDFWLPCTASWDGLGWTIRGVPRFGENTLPTHMTTHWRPLPAPDYPQTYVGPPASTMNGVLGGYVVEASDGKNRYRIVLVNGFRRINIPVTITICDGQWAVLVEGKPRSIKEIIRYDVIRP